MYFVIVQASIESMIDLVASGFGQLCAEIKPGKEHNIVINVFFMLYLVG